MFNHFGIVKFQFPDIIVLLPKTESIQISLSEANMIKKTINPQKASRVSVLAEMITKAKSIAVVDYTKMTPNQATELRKSVKSVGGEIKVEKNTLFRIALQSSNDQIPMTSDQFKGLSAFVFSYNDEIAAPKVIADFIKKNNILTFKMGIMGDRIMSQSEIVSLSQTPSKEVSLGKLLYLLNFNISKLARTLDAIAKRG